MARKQALPDENWTQVRLPFATLLTSIVPVRVHRGQLDEVKRRTRLFAELEQSADLHEQAQVHGAEGVLLLAEGRTAEALHTQRRRSRRGMPWGAFPRRP